MVTSVGWSSCVKTNRWLHVKFFFWSLLWWLEFINIHQYKATTEHEDTNTWFPTVFILSNFTTFDCRTKQERERLMYNVFELLLNKYRN